MCRCPVSPVLAYMDVSQTQFWKVPSGHALGDPGDASVCVCVCLCRYGVWGCVNMFVWMCEHACVCLWICVRECKGVCMCVDRNVENGESCKTLAWEVIFNFRVSIPLAQKQGWWAQSNTKTSKPTRPMSPGGSVGWYEGLSPGPGALTVSCKTEAALIPGLWAGKAGNLLGRGGEGAGDRKGVKFGPKLRLQWNL